MMTVASRSFYHAYNRRDLTAMMAEIADDVFYEDLVRRGKRIPAPAAFSVIDSAALLR